MLELIMTVLLSLAALAAILVIPCRIIRQKAENKNLKLLMYVLLVVWCARFVVGCFGSVDGPNGLNWVENIFDSMLHALQTFGMDEDYAAYTTAGKELLVSWGLAPLAPVYGFVISVINVFAPILGGALLLDILLGMFPVLRMNLVKKRHKFVFSELNEKSIALAEDIARDENYKKVLDLDEKAARPAIIFADPAMDTESEEGAELNARAKDIGAICIKTNLRQLELQKSASVSYFLMRGDGNSNIAMLSQLLEGDAQGNVCWPKAPEEQEPVTRFYVFGQEKLGGGMIKEICRRHAGNSARAMVRNLRDSMNAAFNLMDDVPLFLPLQAKTPDKRDELHITVLGSTPLAEECLKAAYWCGQLDGVKLHLHMAAPGAGALESKLRIECPELAESCVSGSPMLRTHPKNPASGYNPPYCEKLCFIDVEEGFALADLPGELLDRTDYWIVAGETDEENLRLTGQLKLLLTRAALAAGDGRHCAVVPAVGNDRLAETIVVRTPGAYEPYVIPFATEFQLYSCKNVFMADFTAQALTTEQIYRRKHQKVDLDDEYKYWANMARTIHAPYKMFGLGLIDRMDMEKCGPEKYVISGTEGMDQDRFAWMEHRRWNAFMRSQGFICPNREQLDAVYDLYHSYKNIPLKLHPCLVESVVTPMPLPREENFDPAAYDALDYVNMYVYYLNQGRRKEKGDLAGLLANDYKQWDYLEYDSAAQALVKRAAAPVEI